MHILIVGSGLSGCSLARLLKDRGHNISIIEKQNRIGGLCVTETNEYGLKYEPFGARTFHSKNPIIIEFISRFDKFNGYIHRKGMIIHEKLFPFPITKKAIYYFEENKKIFEELDNRPKEVDKANFESACLSLFGRTLYDYFIGNYTKKMWGIDPKEMTAEWAPKRLELRENDDDKLFSNQWQGLPLKGYSFLLEEMIRDMPVKINSSSFSKDAYDVIVSSAPIDETMNFKFGMLQYRSLRFNYKKGENWEREDYGTINLPQHPTYIRKCNFSVLHKIKSANNMIQYQEAVPVSNENIPMYPVITEKSEAMFNKYLRGICQTAKICPLGRLGLFKYLDMDRAVEVAFKMVDVVENYLNLNPEEKYNQIMEIRNAV